MVATPDAATSGAAGDIDVEALRRKYSQPREVLQAQMKGKGTSPETSLPASVTGELPVPVHICRHCQAAGIVKKQYGFRVIDEQCEACQGEGVIVHRPKPATADFVAKIEKVEELVQHASSLSELDELEAALRSGNLDPAKLAQLAAGADN